MSGRAARASHGAAPPRLKRLGQHFLTDARAVERIADALAIVPGDTVVEIGPGRGVLTDRLIARVSDRGRVVAVELDRALAQLLRERYAERPNVHLVQADVLHTDLGALGGGDYLLVGNVPYYITTPILFHALAGALPRRAVFLVQREVAERAAAAPGGKTYGALSVNLQCAATVEPLFDVPPGAFRPPPTVDSAVLRVTPLSAALIPASERVAFQRFTQSVFGLRRKQMGRVLRTLLGEERAAAVLARVGSVAPDARPETLSPEAFARLFRAVRQREG